MITLVFGAGASYGSGKCIPSNPPLGNYLFDDLVLLGGAYSKLSSHSKMTFKSEGFEAGMATIANDSRLITPLQKELACYLSGFSITPENAYTRLFNKLSSRMQRISITTLNYDLLIEQALGFHGFSCDYNAQKQGVTLLKPHGSSNFLPQMPKGCNFSGNTMRGCGTFYEGLETQAVSSSAEVKSWCNNPINEDLSPVLSMYEKGKRVVVNTKLIENCQKKYSQLVKDSDLVILVGIKYIEHDLHIWQPIEQGKQNVVIVDPYPQETINWANKVKLKSMRVIPKGFNNAIWDIVKEVNAYCTTTNT